MNRKTIHITPSSRFFSRKDIQWLVVLVGLFIALLVAAVGVAMLLDPMLSDA